MSDILLSICIPVHNRCDYVKTNILDLLKIEREDFDIIISDSSDPEKRLDRYIKVNDNRLKVYSYDNTATAMKNWENALSHGDGKYIFHLNDRDVLMPDSLNDFLAFLYMNELNGGICLKTTRKRKNKIFIHPKDSLLNIPYNAHHPTGIFFKKSSYMAISNRILYFSESYGTHPHDLVLGQLSKEGSLCIYRRPLWKIADYSFLRNNKSGFHSTNCDMFFTPAERIRELQIAITQLEEINFPIDVSNKKKKAMIKRYFWLSTINYFYHLGKEDIAEHYNFIPVKLTPFQKIESVGKTMNLMINKLKLSHGYYLVLIFYYVEFCICEQFNNIKKYIKRMIGYLA